MQKKRPVIDLQHILKKNLSIEHQYSEMLSNQTHIIVLNNYRLLSFLGKGSYGEVFKAVDQKTKRFVAIKIINKELMWIKNPSTFVQQKLKKFLNSEQILMRKCHSAFVVKLLQTFQSDKLKLFVMQFCEGGNLQEMIEEKNGLDENDAIEIIRQMLLGLAELHRNRIIHRDLKPANILIHHGIFKITDFGFSTQIQFEDEEQNRTRLGTRSTMAPEVQNGKEYGLKADIWSIGMIYFMMLYTQTKLSKRHLSAIEILQANSNFKFRTITKEFISEESQNFLAKTLEIVTSKRANWEQILQNSLFTKQFERLPLIYMPLSTETIHKVNRLSIEQADIEPLILQSQEFTIFINNMNNWIQENLVFNFQDLTCHYLQCRKSQFIYLDIIKPIQQKKLLNLQKRSHLELLILLIDRCHSNIKLAKEKVAQLYDVNISQNFNKKISKLDQNIHCKYEEYYSIYQKLNEKFKYKITDLFYKIFKPQKLQEKSRFLGLQEAEDGKSGYTKEEQIKFTVEKYLVDIINQLDGNQSDKETIQNIFKSYHKINFFESIQIQNQSIKECFQKIVEEYQEK